MRRTLLLDLDGTLIDTAPDLAAALDAVLIPLGLAPMSLPETRRMIGDGTRMLVERAFAARGRPPLADDFDAFTAHYAARVAQDSRPYPGVLGTLDRLGRAGWRLAICTNKPERLARALLDAFDLGGRFAAIGGGDSFPSRKPDPAHLLATVRAAGGTAQRAVMVGDHANDILAATAAGIPCIFAEWGYGSADAPAGATATAARFDVLPERAEALLAADSA